MKREEVIVNLIEDLYTTATIPAHMFNFAASVTEALTPALSLSQQEKDLIKKHFKNGANLLRRIQPPDKTVGSFDQLLRDLMGFAIVVDSNNTILATNNYANVFNVKTGTKLQDLPIEDSTLEDIQSTIEHLTPECEPAILSHCSLGQRENTQLLIKCHRLDHDKGNDFKCNCSQVFLISAVDITIHDEAINIIAETFNLSPAEAKVAQLLGNGIQPNAIAENRNASINTVRTQIKKILKKVGADGISDLVRTLCGFNSAYHSLQYSGSTTPKQTAGKFELSINENQTTRWQSIGPDDGFPIFLLHDTWELPNFNEELAEQCILSELKLILVYRPGYGHTPTNELPPPHLQLEKLEQDIICICEQKRIESFCLWGLGTGAVLIPPLLETLHQNVDSTMETPSFESSLLTDFFENFRTHIPEEFIPEVDSFFMEAFYKFQSEGSPESFENFLGQINNANYNAIEKSIDLSSLMDNLRVTFENGPESILADLQMSLNFRSNCEAIPNTCNEFIGTARDLKISLITEHLPNRDKNSKPPREQ